MSTDSEVRGSRLAERVEEIEKLIRSGATVTGASLASLLNTAQAQLDANRLEDEQITNDKKEKEQKDRSAIAAMVERETKLNEEEKKKYSEFLAKDCFTKSDFGDLSHFYADGGAYDRLSEEGKAEMDHRVIEGVRRGHYTRDEIPDAIEKRVYRNETRDIETKAQNTTVKTAVAEQASGTAAALAKKESQLELGVERQEPPESKQKAKPTIPEGLAGLASLSPVQETDAVAVPQTGKDSSTRQIGG